MIALPAVFRALDHEYNEFARVEPARRLHDNPQLCALLLLDRLVPTLRASMVRPTREGTIALRVSLQALSEAASEEDIATLLRCGVYYDEDFSCLVLSD